MRAVFCAVERVIKIEKGAERELVGAEKDTVIADMVRRTSSGHPMPALGVSLHDETVADMAVGDYLVFEFDAPAAYDGYPFEALALKLYPEPMTGLQFLRRQSGRWEGRCLYWQCAPAPVVSIHSLQGGRK